MHLTFAPEPVQTILLDSLITSKTRIKLLLKFFSNSNATSHLRGLAVEFDESTNAVRLELNKLTNAGLLQSSDSGNKKVYQANRKHPLFPELNSIVMKYLGLDKLIIDVIHKLGDLKLALITGDYANGNDSGIIDLVLVGDIDRDLLHRLIGKAETLIKRKVRPLVLLSEEYENLKGTIAPEKALILWEDGVSA
ncbi:MAG: ArsR family transcriptional regulator [Bacteroidia bacterium]